MSQEKTSNLLIINRKETEKKKILYLIRRQKYIKKDLKDTNNNDRMSFFFQIRN